MAEPALSPRPRDAIVPRSAKGVDVNFLNAQQSSLLIQGTVMGDHWKRQSGQFRTAFLDQIRTGMANGESTLQMAARISGGTVGGIQFPGIIKTSRKKAETLVRTAVNATSNHARIATFQNNPEMIKAIVQVSTLDGRTSETCVAYSGQMWDVETLEPVGGSSLPFNGGPPRHFGCRSSLNPVLKSFEEMGLGDFDLPEGTRASLDGQVAADISFDEFLLSKSETFQNRLLGVGRASLWRQGKITLQDLVNQNGRPLTLGQLEERVGIREAAPPRRRRPRVTEVPEFRTNEEARLWVRDNLIRDDRGWTSRDGRRRWTWDKDDAVGWLKSYKLDGIQAMARVTLMMRDRFGLKLPTFIGDSSKHPAIKFRGGSKALASVHMESDALMFKGPGTDKTKQFNTTKASTEKRNKPETRNRLREGARQTLSLADRFGWSQALKDALNDQLDRNDFAWTVFRDLDPDRAIEHVEDTFIHEAGHRFHAFYRADVDEAIAKIDRQEMIGWQGQTSDYGKTTIEEFVAEQFVRYMIGDHVRVPPALLAVFRDKDRGGDFPPDFEVGDE